MISKRNFNLNVFTIFFLTPQNNLFLLQSSSIIHCNIIHSVQALIVLFLSCTMHDSSMFYWLFFQNTPESIHISPFPIIPAHSPTICTGSLGLSQHPDSPPPSLLNLTTSKFYTTTYLFKKKKTQMRSGRVQ